MRIGERYSFGGEPIQVWRFEFRFFIQTTRIAKTLIICIDQNDIGWFARGGELNRKISDKSQLTI